MKTRTAILIAFLLLLAGCIRLPSSGSPAPSMYRLQYQPPSQDCDKGPGRVLRLRDFSASEPYGQQWMVLQGGNRTVRISASSKWVAPPGAMLSQALRRDLESSGLFGEVIQGSSPGSAPLELDGKVLVFAAEESDSGYRALLRARIRLTGPSFSEAPLLRETYSLRSDPFPKRDAAGFAREMSLLAGELSQRIQADLCRMLDEFETSGQGG